MLTNKDILTPPTFLAYSLGCRTNQAEIEDISLQLTNCGFIPYSLCSSETLKLCPVPSGTGLCISPTVVLLNTCVVTQKAERETRKEIRRLRKLYPQSFLIVIGCAVTAKEKFNLLLPEACLLISNQEKESAIKTILKKISLGTQFSDSRVVCQKEFTLNKYHLSGKKFIKIQDGCNKFCSYCITAHLRGKPKSVPSKKIIEEINYWVNKGIKEVTLTGINIDLYGKDLKPKINISELLKKILNETAVERISLSSIYPEMIYLKRSDLRGGRTSNKLVDLVLNSPRISCYFHFTLQSGSLSVLKRMNREIDLNQLRKSLQFIKSKIPEFTFRADIIVGFPTETDKNFQETLDFIEKAPIPFVHVFPYSVRPGTLAEKMLKKGVWKDLPMTIKKERAKKIMELTKKIQKEEAEKLIGKTLPCLIVRKISDDYEAIANNSWPIKIRITNNEQRTKGTKGKILPVKITYFKDNQLLGGILSWPTYSRRTSGITTDPSFC